MRDRVAAVKGDDEGALAAAVEGCESAMVEPGAAGRRTSERKRGLQVLDEQAEETAAGERASQLARARAQNDGGESALDDESLREGEARASQLACEPGRP